MELNIDQKALDDMRVHAEETYPDECCGFFFGHERDGVRKVVLAKRVKNSKAGDRSDRFEIATQDYRKAEQYAQEHGLELLGVYHSHPDHPAEPSEHDRKVAMPWFSYIIVSVQDGEASATRSWQLNKDRQFEEEPADTKNFSEQQKP